MAEQKTCTVYRDSAGEWRWRVTASNGKVVGDSSEGYSRLTDCKTEAEKLFGDSVVYQREAEA